MNKFLPVCFSTLKSKDNEINDDFTDDKMIDLFLSCIIKYLDDPEILLRKEVFLLNNK